MHYFILHTGVKRVNVGATPGKTKHFQTLIISDDIMLVDCPGLVFPTFMESQANLYCNGILPIDQLRSVTRERATLPPTHSLLFLCG